MTKQRLAEIMKEIHDGSDELHNNGTMVLMSVGDRNKDGLHIGFVGSADNYEAYHILTCMLNAIWLHDERGLTFEEFVEEFYGIVIEAYENGLIGRVE